MQRRRGRAYAPALITRAFWWNIMNVITPLPASGQRSPPTRSLRKNRAVERPRRPTPNERRPPTLAEDNDSHSVAHVRRTRESGVMNAFGPAHGFDDGAAFGGEFLLGEATCDEGRECEPRSVHRADIQARRADLDDGPVDGEDIDGLRTIKVTAL